MARQRTEITVTPFDSPEWRGRVHLIDDDGLHYVVSERPFPPFEEVFQETIDEEREMFNSLVSMFGSEEVASSLTGVESADDIERRIRESEAKFRQDYEDIVQGRVGETAIFRTDENGSPLESDPEPLVNIDGLDAEAAIAEFLKL